MITLPLDLIATVVGIGGAVNGARESLELAKEKDRRGFWLAATLAADVINGAAMGAAYIYGITYLLNYSAPNQNFEIANSGFGFDGKRPLTMPTAAPIEPGVK